MTQMQETKRSLLSEYSIALLACLMALLFRFLLAPLLGKSAPLLVFIMPVMLSAWYGGLKSGLLYLCPSISRVDDLVRLCIFLIEGGLISVFSETLRRTKQRSEAIALLTSVLNYFGEQDGFQ